MESVKLKIPISKKKTPRYPDLGKKKFPGIPNFWISSRSGFENPDRKIQNPEKPNKFNHESPGLGSRFEIFEKIPKLKISRIRFFYSGIYPGKKGKSRILEILNARSLRKFQISLLILRIRFFGIFWAFGIQDFLLGNFESRSGGYSQILIFQIKSF